MSRVPPAVIVASAVSPHVAYLSGRLFDWVIREIDYWKLVQDKYIPRI